MEILKICNFNILKIGNRNPIVGNDGGQSQQTSFYNGKIIF